jgi:hypothetical protein
MNKFEELVNDYTLVGDDGAVIFSSYDRFLEFVEEIRQMQRKPLSPQSPCEMTPDERKMFRLGWLECEAAHGITEVTK